MWKILIVEDDFVTRKLLTEFLKELATFDIATNGNEAIQAFDLSVKENSSYDVILMDISMPEPDGIEVVDYIRNNEANMGIFIGEGVPIIMITAHQKPFMEAFGKGCDDYLVKPINKTSVINIINKNLRNK